MKKLIYFPCVLFVLFVLFSCSQISEPFSQSNGTGVSLDFRASQDIVGDNVVVSIFIDNRLVQSDRKEILNTDSAISFDFPNIPVNAYINVKVSLLDKKDNPIMKGETSLRVKQGANPVVVELKSCAEKPVDPTPETPVGPDTGKPVDPDTGKPETIEPINGRFVLWCHSNDDNTVDSSSNKLYEYPKFFITEKEPVASEVVQTEHFCSTLSGNQVFDYYIDDNQFVWDYEITGGSVPAFRIGKVVGGNTKSSFVKEIKTEKYVNQQTSKEEIKYLYSNIYKYEQNGKDVILLSGFDYSSGKNIIYYYFDNGTENSGVITLPSISNITDMVVTGKDLYYLENGAGFVVKKVAGFTDKINGAVGGNLDWSNTGDVTVFIDGTTGEKIKALGLDNRLCNITDLQVKNNVLFLLGLDNNKLPEKTENTVKRSKGFLMYVNLSDISPTPLIKFLRKETQEEINKNESIFYPETDYNKNFLGPRRFVANVPGKLVIADDGVFGIYKSGQSPELKSKNRIVIVDVSDINNIKFERTIELNNVTFDGYKSNGTPGDYFVNVSL